MWKLFVEIDLLVGLLLSDMWQECYLMPLMIIWKLWKSQFLSYLIFCRLSCHLMSFISAVTCLFLSWILVNSFKMVLLCYQMLLLLLVHCKVLPRRATLISRQTWTKANSDVFAVSSSLSSSSANKCRQCLTINSLQWLLVSLVFNFRGLFALKLQIISLL